jgi:hypothetical protein
LTQEGNWVAAVLACGPEAVLSHGSAAALWGFGLTRSGKIDVSAVVVSHRERPGIVIHRRSLSKRDRTAHEGIPVTTPIRTLVDRAAVLDRKGIEREINGADKRRLVTPPGLRKALGGYRGQRGVARLRHVLDRRTFRLAGLTPLRFTHEQVKYEPRHVRETLARVAARLGS